MTIRLKQSTASQEIPLGYFVDSLDGNTEETGLTIANTDIKLWKMGATSLANKNSGGATHMANGIYYAVLDATDTNTLGALVVFVHVSGALAVKVECEVLAANVYDSLIAATDKIQVHTDEMTAGIITSTVLANDAITAAKVASDVTTELQSGLATASALTTVAGYLDTEIAAILAAVDTEVAAIKAKTDNLPSDPADDSDIDTQLAAIAAYLDTEIAAILAAVDTEIAAIKAKTDNLPSDPADDSDIDAQLAAIAGYLDTEIAAIKAKTDNLPTDPADQSAVEAAITAGLAGLNDLSAAEVNAQVLDVLATDTFAEPGAVPAATASLKDKIGWLFMLARNKRLTTATADKVRNDADSSDVGTAVLSDDGSTFTRGEFS
jgi:hypothetical protein